MSKRRKETKEEQWSRLMEAYEQRFEEEPKPKRRRIIYSSSSSEDEVDVPNEEHLPSTYNENNNDSENIAPNVPNNNICESVDSFDPELIKALGETESEVVQFGEDLQGDIATRFQNILVNGLKKETREELNKKYLFPKNVPMAKAPTLNPEINAMLVETCRLRDKRLLGKQDQLGRALAALGKGMTLLLMKNPNISEVVTILNDAGKLIADSHFMETDTRRSVITPLIDKSFIEAFKDRKRDNLLFGEKLCDLVNNSKGIKKTSQLIQASTSTNTGLNLRGPSSYRTRQQRAGQSYPRRVGGPPTTYPHYPQTNRRRGPPQPAPGAGRRYPPPPPPPPPPTHARRQQAQAHRSYYRRRN